MEACTLHKESFDANQFDFVDFGYAGPHNPVDNMDSSYETPQIVDLQADNSVGESDFIHCLADFSQNGLSRMSASQPQSDNFLAGNNFNFDFSKPIGETASAARQERPRYVPSTAHSSFPAYLYPSPPNPAMDTAVPYPNASAFPWEAAPTIPPLYQHNFGGLTPPGKQLSSLDTSILMYGSLGQPSARRVGPKYKPIRKAMNENDSEPEDYALSSPAITRKRRAQPRSPLGEGQMTKKARRATIKNFLDAHAKAQSTAAVPSNGNESDSSALSSLPPTPMESKRPVRTVRLPSIIESDADAEADDTDMEFPANTIDAGRGRRRTSRDIMNKQMEDIKTERHAYSQNPRTPSARYMGISRLPTTSSPPKIQGRRRKHAGRKFKVPQTPEIIARNAARRERYRNALTPSQRAIYDSEKPPTVLLADA